MRLRPLANAVLVPVALSACAFGGGRSRPADFAVLEVHNDYLGPVDLYAIRNGAPQRLGSVSGSKPQRFRLGPSLIAGAGTIRIVAVPFAESGRASTGSITVRAGDVVRFNIASTLAASSVFIR